MHLSCREMTNVLECLESSSFEMTFPYSYTYPFHCKMLLGLFFHQVSENPIHFLSVCWLPAFQDFHIVRTRIVNFCMAVHTFNPVAIHCLNPHSAILTDAGGFLCLIQCSVELLPFSCHLYFPFRKIIQASLVVYMISGRNVRISQ